MRSAVLGLAILISLATVTIGDRDADRVKISVYYEVLCPDSKAFVTEQLYENVFNTSLAQSVIFDLVPYGKAQTSKQNGQYKFTCQHGPRECIGNMMHACSIQLFGNLASVPFVNCMMKERNPDKHAQQCATQTGLDWTKIQQCQSSNGPELLAAMGDRTHSLQPAMKFVPWITFNDQFSEQDQAEALVNLRGVICSKLPGTQAGKPPGC